MSLEEKSTYSVSEYIQQLNTKLVEITGDVSGEVSEVKIAASGHAYFTIKDKESGEILPCTMWRMKYQYRSVDIEIGMELLLRGKPNYYGPFGKLSFIADSMELVGEGALLKAYEKLKQKFESEGALDPANKKPMPLYPHRIGVITSVHGEVIHDFSKNLRKFGFDVKIMDTRVEGAESGKDLALSVRAFRKHDIDALVILRGGGSVQSLAGFDNEALVREIIAFPVPVIAGIGHHRDVPLAALAADAMQSTPSLVAELLNESWSTAEFSLERSENTIMRGYDSFLSDTRRELESAYSRTGTALETIFELYSDAEKSIKSGLSKITFALGRTAETLQKESKSLTYRFETIVKRVHEEYLVKTPVRITSYFSSVLKSGATHIQNAARLIESNNPERQLKLGYSLAFSSGKVVTTSKGLAKGSLLDIRFADGSAEVEVTKIPNN